MSNNSNTSESSMGFDKEELHRILYDIVQTAQIFSFLAYIFVLFIYSTGYYIYFFFFYPCENSFDYTAAWCGFMCYSYVVPNWLSLYEYLAHEIIPMFLELFVSILLILRVISQKRRMRQQAAEWRKNRKMILQLLSIAFVTIVFNVPSVISPLVQLTLGIQPISEDVQTMILDYVGYGSPIFLPFACLATVSHLKTKLKKMIEYRRWLAVLNNRRRTIIGMRTNAVTPRR